MSYFHWPNDSHGIDEFGSKGVAISALQNAGFETPAWFAISPEAFYSSLTDKEYESLMFAAEESKLPTIDLSFQVSYALNQNLTKALNVLCPGGERVAVRASPLETEWSGDYTRGLLENFLFVAIDDVTRAVCAIWESAFSHEVLESRMRKRLPPVPKAPAVIVQRMLNPECSGTAYSADPESGRRSLSVVRSVFGLSTSMVSKESVGDLFVVWHDEKILLREIAKKTVMHQCDNLSHHGIEQADLPPEKAILPSLTDDQVLEVAAMARKAGKCFGKPQSVEWAITGNRLYVLQANPIIELRGKPDPEAEVSYWSGRLQSEDYPGVLSPLTYSLADYLYRLRTLALCQSLGVPETKMKQARSAVNRLTGMIHGRFHVELIELHRIATLVASKSSCRDAELLLGMEDTISTDLVELAAKEAGAVRGHGSLGSFRLSTWLSSTARWEGSRVKRFESTIHQLVAPEITQIHDLRPHELVERLNALLEGIEPVIATPVTIDAQILLYHERLRGALKTCNVPEEEVSRLTGPLTTGLSALTTTGFIGDLMKLVAAIPHDSNLPKILQQGSRAVIDGALMGHPDLLKQLHDFVENHGHRVPGELRLDAIDHHENQLPLLRLLGCMAVGQEAREIDETPMVRSTRMAEKRLAMLAGKHSGAVGQANRYIKRLKQLFVLREVCRTAMAEYHSCLRTLTTEVGKRLEALGSLRLAGDVHHLSLDELTQYVLGSGVNSNINTLAASRRRETQAIVKLPAPALEFEAHGVVKVGEQVPPVDPPHGDKTLTKAQFMGASCGTVKARAATISNPQSEKFNPGDILVARETDPGWIFLIVGASGVIVENAGPTSYVAVLCREFGIPCVVRAEGVTQWIRHGDWLEMNGESGEVKRGGAR